MPPRKIYGLTLRKARSYLAERGVDISALLAGTELTPADLENPYRLISEDQARLFYRNAVEITDDPGFGLEMGWTTDMSEMGPLGLMQLVARTVRDAVEAGLSTHRTYYGLVNYTYEDDGDVTIFRLQTAEKHPELRRFLLERTMGVFQASSEELIGPEARPLKVLVDFKAPGYVNRYKEIFRCPVYFERDSVEIHYPREYMDRELKSYDPQALEALKLLQVNLINKLTAQKDVVSEVKMCLRRSPGEYPSLEQVADQLAMSPRNLRRKLGAANTRFQDLLDAERRIVAEDYLKTTDLTIQQIASHCGFSDAQNFSQAFKRWLGVPPSAYRQAHQQPESD